MTHRMTHRVTHWMTHRMTNLMHNERHSYPAARNGKVLRSTRLNRTNK